MQKKDDDDHTAFIFTNNLVCPQASVATMVGGQWGPADVIGRGRLRREERGGLEEEKGEEEEK